MQDAHTRWGKAIVNLTIGAIVGGTGRGATVRLNHRSHTVAIGGVLLGAVEVVNC